MIVQCPRTLNIKWKNTFSDPLQRRTNNERFGGEKRTQGAKLIYVYIRYVPDPPFVTAGSALSKETEKCQLNCKGAAVLRNCVLNLKHNTNLYVIPSFVTVMCATCATSRRGANTTEHVYILFKPQDIVAESCACRERTDVNGHIPIFDESTKVAGTVSISSCGEMVANFTWETD